ncbi:MAG: HK97 family phage prohead protease [Trueperaceae bacterium]
MNPATLEQPTTVTIPPARKAPAHLTDGSRVHRAFTADIHLAEETETTDAGIIEGYASAFNVIDSYGEIIMPGAFTRTIAAWKAKGRPIPVLWQHDTWAPIGATLEIAEDDKGLRVKAQLLVDDVDQAREAHALAAANILGGLSIGFSVPAKTHEGQPAVTYNDDLDVWAIHEVRLWEYSLVTFPANESATIDNVKAMQEAATATAKAAASIAKHLQELRAIVKADPAAPPAGATPRLGAQTALIREAANILKNGRK